MKDLLKSVFNTKTFTPVLFGLGVFLILTFIVFPGLTYPNTIVNIFSSLVGIVVLISVYYYLGLNKIFTSEVEEEVPGETELDYLPKDEIKPKKKPVKKKVKKSEFPMEPHQPRVQPKSKNKNK